MALGRVAMVAGLLVPAVGGLGGVVSVSYSSPSLDRWMYPFNFSAGGESSAPVFGAILVDGFDDRDSQFLVGFATAGEVTPGLEAGAYRVRSARIRVTVSADQRAVYDPEAVGYRSLLPVDDPEYVADATAGKPVELFGVGLRSGLSAPAFQESSPFSLGSPQGESARVAFAASFAGSAGGVDVSNQVSQRFDAAPMAIGRTSAVAPGALMPAGTELSFDVDLCVPGVLAYWQRSLGEGRVLLALTSLEPAAGGPGGGTGEATYPAFYTKESATGVAIGGLAKLELVVQVGPVSDVDGDDAVTIEDLIEYLALYEDGDERADMGADCGVTVDDLIDYLSAYFDGR